MYFLSFLAVIILALLFAYAPSPYIYYLSDCYHLLFPSIHINHFSSAFFLLLSHSFFPIFSFYLHIFLCLSFIFYYWPLKIILFPLLPGSVPVGWWTCWCYDRDYDTDDREQFHQGGRADRTEEVCFLSRPGAGIHTHRRRSTQWASANGRWASAWHSGRKRRTLLD